MREKEEKKEEEEEEEKEKEEEKENEDKWEENIIQKKVERKRKIIKEKQTDYVHY